MFLKDIIKTAAGLLKLDPVLDLPEMGGQSDDGQAKKDLEILKKSVNLTINEIACQYVPLNTVENILTQDGKVMYADLKKPALKINSIKTRGGKNLCFKVFPSYIYTGYDGTASVEYAYIPSENENLDEETEYQNSKITSRVIAYGAAREYCLIMSMYEEAAMYDARYKDALKSACRAQATLKIPKKLWR